jgi:hypothetical protein
MIATCVPIRECIDRVLARFAVVYGLQIISPEDWVVLSQVERLLKPFKEASVLLEGEKYATVPEFLGQLWRACFVAFYLRPVEHAQYDIRVRQLKDQLCGHRGSTVCNN